MWSVSIAMSSDGHTPQPVPRILIANDQEWTARSLESILAAEGYEVVRAFTGNQAFDRALDSRPDLIVLDTQLPDISGPEVCRRLRAHPAVGWAVPIILTTAGSNGRTRMLEAMEAGAWDFATQPFDGPLLLARIRTYLNAKAAFDHASAEATIDGETGAYNRRGLAQRLSELWSDARRRGEPLTCLVIAAQVPELESALEQAQVMAAAVAQAIRSSVRGSDPVARLSPLEFAIMAPNLDHDAALELLDRVQHQLSARTGLKLPVRTGVTTIEPAEGVTIEQALDRASHAVDWSPGAPSPVINQ
jgi:two-component system chemotaxis response regulator CheY